VEGIVRLENISLWVLISPLALFGQVSDPRQTSDIKTVVTTLEQQVNAALDAGDLMTASKRAHDLVTALNTELLSRMPSPQQRLATLETAYANAKGAGQF
jgi:hypothetical protein